MDDPLLTSCIKAALTKAFEFVELSFGRMRNDYAFHCMAGLRSVCEDLIVLKFIAGLTVDEQEKILRGTMILDTEKAMRRQVPFFATFRVGQPVMNGWHKPDLLAKTKDELVQVWKALGWPKNKDGGLPPTSEIARKIGPDTLSVLYEYVYRLTSGMVHFSTRALLRTGWGNEGECRFSTTNMDRYSGEFCRVYGIFLLTVYFEFFGTLLGMDDNVARIVKRLRRFLIQQNRWPEMITFEEMNHKVPKRSILAIVLEPALATHFENGFIAGAEKVALLKAK